MTYEICLNAFKSNVCSLLMWFPWQLRFLCAVLIAYSAWISGTSEIIFYLCPFPPPLHLAVKFSIWINTTCESINFEPLPQNQIFITRVCSGQLSITRQPDTQHYITRTVYGVGYLHVNVVASCPNRAFNYNHERGKVTFKAENILSHDTAPRKIDYTFWLLSCRLTCWIEWNCSTRLLLENF